MKAEKRPDWKLHLATCADIVSFAFAYDHQNYTRSVYLAEIFLLPDTAPEVHALFVSGNHVVQRSKSGSFNNVCSDLGLQQSIVKDSKSTKGVIIRIS